ncbi:MAG: inositol monophosphatase family protein [Dehalococcoidia bacterium]
MSQSAAIPQAASGLSALEVARRCAREAGEHALTKFRQPQDVAVKGRGNLVTETDFELETYITKTLRREFPHHKVLSEETATETDTAGWVWVVDPLDGTKNFVSGIPFFCINIALCHDATPVVAVTHDPNHSETFAAARGQGAWVNDRPARVSDKATVEQSVLGIDLGYDDERGKATLHLAHELFPGMQSLRIPGSAALGLAYAACSRYDLFLHNMLFPWDIAAGILLVQEAGGTITERDGHPVAIASTTALAGGRAVHDDFLRWQREHSDRLDPLSEA